MSKARRRELLAHAKKQRRDHEEMLPIAIVEGRETMVVGMEFGEHRERQEMMHRIGSTLGFGLDARRLFVIVDIWKGTADAGTAEALERGETPEGYVQPSKDPNRTEALLIAESGRDGPGGALMCDYERGPKGFRFAEAVEMPEHKDFTFTYFWQGLVEAEEAVKLLARMTGMDLDDIGPSGRTPLEFGRMVARAEAVTKLGALVWP